MRTVEARQFLSDLCEKHGVECGHPRTAARLIDKVGIASLIAIIVVIAVYCFA
jgi:hypothetical protein